MRDAQDKQASLYEHTEELVASLEKRVKTLDRENTRLLAKIEDLTSAMASRRESLVVFFVKFTSNCLLKR